MPEVVLQSASSSTRPLPEEPRAATTPGRGSAPPPVLEVPEPGPPAPQSRAEDRAMRDTVPLLTRLVAGQARRPGPGDKVHPAEGNDDDGFKKKKGKQRNNRHFHRGKYDENAWKPKENQTLQNNLNAALQNTDEDLIDVTDMQKSSDIEAKMRDALNQIVTVQQMVDNNEKVKEKQMEEAKEKQIDELKKVERISAKEWIEKHFGKQLNDKGEIISQQVSKVTSGTLSQEKEHDVLQEQEKEHEVLQEDGSRDILISKILEEENKFGDVLQEDDDHEGNPIEDVEDKQTKEGQEGTRLLESNTSVSFPVEQVENSQHGKHEEIQAQADINSHDEEDLSQNIEDIAQEADLSPRSVHKLKQATNKQKPVRSVNIPVAGVSTRRNEWLGVVISESEQQVTLQLTHSSLNQAVLVSVVYAKCDRQEKEELWEDMVALANQQDLPWIIGGDFNVIVSEEEKQGGLPVTFNETLDFSTCIQSCGLIDVGFTGSKFTWCNGRTEEDCIFKRLDRILVNQQVLDIMPSAAVTHMIRHGSDHAPLHLECNNNAHHIVKSFKFLNFWTKHHTFMEMIATIEDTIKVKELQFENNASRENRMLLHQAQAELTRFLHLEEEYWKQKDDPSGTWLENEVDVGSEAIRFFESQFSEENSGGDYALLKNLPKLITEETQKNMEEFPSESEVKEAVFSLNGDSASGPDGFTGQFYQKCWEVIKLDVIQMVKAFFCGCEVPQFITHTNLVLLPKKEAITTFSDMRPISLSSFSNKILSKILQNRLEKVLPNIISHNQTGIVKGRSIAENILLAQEIIRDINLRAKHTNVVIKSSRGVKQVDPLSPTLFIIAAEVLARNLNKLHEKPSFIGYGMPKWSPQINHLSYADDTILFCSGDGYSLKKMMRRLRNYEKASGQLVNTDKSCYYVHHKVSARVNSKIKRYTKMRNDSFPFTYLGCPVFYGRRKLIYYEDLIKKVMKRILSWQNRLLSFGGRYVLVNHVLQTMPVYLLSAMNPPSGVIKQLHKIFAKFFWSNTVGVKSKH
ncbi:uncharacterized protein LOC132607882 [Lycium barbarum]|uniref:uncharacterized protein LOC132607882 n=1 Tax=Lycium barbarum TaxID=112863 RepID=UPI00293EC4BF|nr:uncharacterized protein LOC132607882 [Lycium barbarum]